MHCKPEPSKTVEVMGAGMSAATTVRDLVELRKDRFSWFYRLGV